MRFALILCAWFGFATLASAHDAWVQTNTHVLRSGDVIHIDLMLGNHGNDHRDYKLASKISLDAGELDVLAPDDKSYDLKPRLADLGYAPKEGFWSARFVPGATGLHTIAYTRDAVLHGARGIKSAKAFFLVSESLDKIPADAPGFNQPLGHALELVPVANPVAPMGPGQPIRVQVLYQGKPLPEARVSFIPRGETLAEGFDPRYERRSDAKGLAEFIPAEGNYYLVVVHHEEPDQKGEGYDKTRYSATMSVFVPQVCPCCGE